MRERRRFKAEPSAVEGFRPWGEVRRDGSRNANTKEAGPRPVLPIHEEKPIPILRAGILADGLYRARLPNASHRWHRKRA